MNTKMLNDELEKIISSYTIEDYYCDRNAEFLSYEIETILKETQEKYKQIIEEKVPAIVRANRIKLEKPEYHQNEKLKGSKFDFKAQEYLDLKDFANKLFMNFSFTEYIIDKKEVDQYGREEKFLERNGAISKITYNHEPISDVVKHYSSFFTNQNLEVPTGWKDIISIFLESDIEKIGIVDSDYANRSKFTFKTEDFNFYEMASIVSIKKALAKNHYFKNNNRILLDLNNGLSCLIKFKKKGKIISRYCEGNNKVISSEIESFYDENKERSIGKLNRYYYFLINDNIILIEFIQTGILK